MNLDFAFKHNQLSLVELHQKGIRETKDIEEVILGESFWEEISKDEYGRIIFLATGFSRSITPIAVAFIVEYDEPTIITLDAKRATIDEIKENFCKPWCKKRK